MKTLKIAIQDFKRLMFNPIMLLAILAAVVIFITAGYFFKPVVNEGISVSYSTKTLVDLYNGFTGGASVKDSKVSLNKYIEENQQIISAQHSQVLIHAYEDNVDKIKELFGRVDLYNKFKDVNRVYDSYNQDLQIISNFDSFITEVTETPFLQSTLYVTADEYTTMTMLNKALKGAFNPSFRTKEEVAIAYDAITSSISLYERFIALSPLDVVFPPVILNTLEDIYIKEVQTKLQKIENEIVALSSEVQTTENLAKMTSLIYNYKYQAMMANKGLKAELHIRIINHSESYYKNIFNVKPENVSELTTNVILSNYVLGEESLYYNDYLTAMRFNSATGKVTGFDLVYTLLTIVGFMTTILAIYFAYRLYGQDRKNGKMDIVLTQNVSFGNVFSGKFLAILFSTSLLLVLFFALFMGTGFMMYGMNFTSILAVYNLTTPYLIGPVGYLLIKLACLELEAVFYTVITIFLMNISRKFEIMLIIAYGIFVFAFVGNMLLSGVFVYTLLPFVHANLFSFFGGATSKIGIFNTMFIVNGNIYISLIYYLVITIAFYNFTNQLFRRN